MNDRRAWQPYVREIADRMRLRDWTIVILDDCPDSAGTHADISRTPGRRHARMRLSERFLRDAEEEQRDTIVHELIHCIFAVSDALVDDATSEAEYSAWRTAMEYAVDDLAAIIAPTMPLPSAILGG